MARQYETDDAVSRRHLLSSRFSLGSGSSRAIVSLELFNIFDFDNVEIGSANYVYGRGTVLQNGALMPAPVPATFGQVKDANGNRSTSR